MGEAEPFTHNLCFFGSAELLIFRCHGVLQKVFDGFKHAPVRGDFALKHIPLSEQMLGAVRPILQYVANSLKAHADGAVSHDDGDSFKVCIGVVPVPVELIVCRVEQASLLPVVKRADCEPV